MIFSNQVVVVTGAAQGIGFAIAKAFVGAQATVHLVDVDADKVLANGERLRVSAHCVDLSQRDRAMDLIDTICARDRAPSVLINAAGGVGGQVGKPLEHVTPDEWRALFAANVDSAFWLSQAVVPGMKQHGSGRIVNIASGAGLRASLTGIQAYAGAKHAVVGITRQLAAELGPFGITVNAIAPGFVLSNPTTQAQWQSYGESGQSRLVESIHMRRTGSPEDIAAAALFFASEAANWITGQVLSVDGGRA